LTDKHESLDLAPSSGAVVVLIHGILMPARVMRWMARRLRRRGLDTAVFAYPSRHATTRQNAARLATFVANIDAPVVHYVAHSLGGLVLTQMLQDYPEQRPGRVVMLGTPYRGSYVARRLSRYGWGRWLCGLSLEGALLGDGPRWPGGRDLGVIAGTLPIGACWIAPGLSRPHDGTVAVVETEVPGQTAGIRLKVSHTALLFSASVANQVSAFLATGKFLVTAPSSCRSGRDGHGAE